MSRRIVAIVSGGTEGAGFRTAADLLLSPLLGRSVVSYVLEAAACLGPESVFLDLGGKGGESQPEIGNLKDRGGKTIPVVVLPAKKPTESPRAGIAPVIRAALPHLRNVRALDVMLIPAGLPLLRPLTLQGLLAVHRRQGCDMTLMNAGPDVERDQIAVLRAEGLDSLVRRAARRKRGAWFPGLAELIRSRGGKVGRCAMPDAWEVLTVARRTDLPAAALLLRGRKNETLVENGVVLFDPSNTWVDWDAEVGEGTVLYPSIVIEGPSRIGRGCRIYPHVHIMNARIGDGARVLSSSVLEDCTLEADTQVGPFTRLRPGTVVLAGSRVGNFVEMKNTVFGPRSKAMHLSYLGDSRVEEEVNIGAGTITCNFDGVRKNPTHIGAGAFIGSGTELVAPVRVGRKAYVAAGSTITKDVPPDSLAIARARQVEKPGWVAERVKKLRKAKRAPK